MGVVRFPSKPGFAFTGATTTDLCSTLEGLIFIILARLFLARNGTFVTLTSSERFSSELLLLLLLLLLFWYACSFELNENLKGF